MANDKLVLARTDAGALASNLRGEIGEVITTWIIMRHFISAAARLRTDDLDKDSANRNLLFANLLADKLSDETVARLSELAERKISRLTFHFAAAKLGQFDDEVKAFSSFVMRHKIRDKRNRDISHKQMPGKAPDTAAYLHIPYRILLRGVALALRLMKKIDRHVLGPSSPFLWKEARKRRYAFLSPPHAGYMLIPYLNLSPDERIEIVRQELAEGRTELEKLPTTIHGQAAYVLACKPWGVIFVGGQFLGLARYPLVRLDGLSFEANETAPTTGNHI